MYDCISRQTAVDALGEKPLDWTEDEYELGLQNQWKYDVDAIKALPPITPKQKTGHWIEDAKTYYEELNKRGLGVDEYTPYFTDDIACSECLAKYSMLDNETQFFKHCPNCGAKMVEPQESEALE